MTIKTAYLLFLTKVNRNLNSNNITADHSRFVLYYNESQVRRISQLVLEGNDERLREIQGFLKPNVDLDFDVEQLDRRLYKLPKDYKDFSSSYALGDKNGCKNKKIDLHEIKDKNYTQVLSDNFNKPSFEYRESPIIVADDKLNVFTAKDFTFSKVVLTYYRYPKEIDIEGYTNVEGGASTDINPEGNRDFVDKVISMAAEDFARNYGDIQGVQIHKDRIKTNQ